MTDLERMLAAVQQPGAEAISFLGIADALGDEGHPAGEELADLAVEISTSDDWAIVQAASAVFLAILQRDGFIKGN